MNYLDIFVTVCHLQRYISPACISWLCVYHSRPVSSSHHSSISIQQIFPLYLLHARHCARTRGSRKEEEPAPNFKEVLLLCRSSLSAAKWFETWGNTCLSFAILNDTLWVGRNQLIIFRKANRNKNTPYSVLWYRNMTYSVGWSQCFTTCSNEKWVTVQTQCAENPSFAFPDAVCSPAFSTRTLPEETDLDWPA